MGEERVHSVRSDRGGCVIEQIQVFLRSGSISFFCVLDASHRDIEIDKKVGFSGVCRGVDMHSNSQHNSRVGLSLFLFCLPMLLWNCMLVVVCYDEHWEKYNIQINIIIICSTSWVGQSFIGIWNILHCSAYGHLILIEKFFLLIFRCLYESGKVVQFSLPRRLKKCFATDQRRDLPNINLLRKH